MTGLSWDYQQEQKNKYANHVRACAEEICQCEDRDFRLCLINNLSSFLKGCGYSDETIGPLHDSINHFQELGNRYKMMKCINQFAANIEVMDLPKSPTSSQQININNSNFQSTNFNISIIEEALNNELSSKQINELKELLKTKKKGDVKAWLADLGNGTLSGVLSAILSSVMGC